LEEIQEDEGGHSRGGDGRGRSGGGGGAGGGRRDTPPQQQDEKAPPGHFRVQLPLTGVVPGQVKAHCACLYSSFPLSGNTANPPPGYRHHRP